MTARVEADEALTALYTSHYRSLVRLAALLLGGDGGLGEEVVQDAYVRMHGAWHRLRDHEAAAAYLRRTVVNLAHSRTRHARVVERHAESPTENMPSAETMALRSLANADVMRALQALPRRQREALVLRYYADLSEAQIAEAMGISAGAVKSHASRGLAALRSTLEPLS